jgi:hypothetical protein
MNLSLDETPEKSEMSVRLKIEKEKDVPVVVSDSYKPIMVEFDMGGFDI